MTARTPSEDVEVAGYKLKKGMNILLSPYTLHRKVEFYPEPDKFIPERFTPENEKKLPRYAYLPFGAGQHSCIGQHFAMIELHLVLAHLIQNLRFELLPGQDIWALPLTALRPSSAQVRIYRRPASRQEPIAKAN